MTLRIPARIEDGKWIGLPFEGEARITDTFGNYPDWRKNFDHDGDPSTPGRDFGPHKGVDLVDMRGPNMPILAADDGQVWWVQAGHPVNGNYVVIVHPSAGGGFQETEATYYLHLSRIDVSTGDEVQGGQQIGLEGATGAVTGRHLHFGVRVNDQYVNPERYFVDDDPPEVPAQLDQQTAMEWFTSEYLLGRNDYGGTRSMDPPEFVGYEPDGKTERWQISLLRPKVERPTDD